MRRFAIVLAACLLSGCALTWSEVGVPVPDPNGFEIGKTTKSDALAQLGPPRLIQWQFDGELYTWRWTKSRSRSLTVLPVYVQAFYYSDGESRRDDLSLLFDREGVLQGFGLRRETEE